jgi:putative ATP-dependent endonuclease of OLD family
LFKALKERVPRLYAATLKAVDPGDASNEKYLEWSKLAGLLQANFIGAHRGLEDSSRRANEALGEILESLFANAKSTGADATDQTLAASLEIAVEKVTADLDKYFKDSLMSLLPAFAIFGYPGLSDPKICTETSLDVQRLLTNHTVVRYTGADGITLPEGHNGLGTRNLIYILLRVLEFFKAFKSRPTAAGLHLVFIEEPEAHLHPQMQGVFIRKIKELVQAFQVSFNLGRDWPAQFVVTTHSSHIANEAPFETVRYFLSKARDEAPFGTYTRVKDLSSGMSEETEENQKFLRQYMTLTRCDLLFADKAVLVEGTSERLLLPKMINQIGNSLSSQYVATIEIGGAYAQKFFRLLDFLELKSLVVTDLDSGKMNENNRLVACKVSEGTRTTNACLKDWFGNQDISPVELTQAQEQQKIQRCCRVAYQTPEIGGGPCGRSFEGAFILANPALFGIAADAPDLEDLVWKASSDVDKTEFALKHAMNPSPWAAPRYITEGLTWLASDFAAPAVSLPAVAAQAAAEAPPTPAAQPNA